jgi:ADP-heptose:LPS heptosyltransferase
LQSEIFLTRPLERPEAKSHRYEHWQTIARELGFELPPKSRLPLISPGRAGDILVHTGAGQPVRVWPLERYRRLIQQLRDKGFRVLVACDHDQMGWWHDAGEQQVASPGTVTELLALIDRTAVFIGNDSGPGHLAAFCECPTFTIFGPQLPEWFAPLHPSAEWVEGKACPYKPCSDYCQFPVPYCMVNSSLEEVSRRVEAFLARVLSTQNPHPSGSLAPA